MITGSYFWKRENGLYYHRIFSKVRQQYMVTIAWRMLRNDEVEKIRDREEQKILRVKKNQIEKLII